MLLRSVMLQAGFAPFDGEWWHFSYGDREWAYYYKKKYALYSQVSLSSLKKVYEIKNERGYLLIH
jgi:D-alanyl-D-alanine dipeptidase